MSLSNNNDGAGTENSFVSNARMAMGLHRFLRCASTDVLANAITEDPNQNLGEFDAVILQEAGLILDLRSSSERKESQAQVWMSSFGFVAKELPTDQAHSDAALQELLHANPRLVVRLDILSPTRFMDYIEQNWLSPEQKLQANLFRTADDNNKLHNLRMELLNRRGLLGLNEGILETGKQGLCTALNLITLHLETIKKGRRPNGVAFPSSHFDVVVIHCVQGKDRTGLLVMLCQALMGVSDEDMISDYHKSHNLRRRRKDTKKNDAKTSAAMELATAASRARQTTSGPQFKLDRSMFHSSPRHVMQSTLEYLRSVYGSVVPGYLNHIGFDASWQSRFQSMASSSDTSVTNTRPNLTRSRL